MVELDDFSVRRADAADSATLAPLFDAYRQFYDCRPDLDLAETYLRERLNRGESIVFLAEQSDGTAVGFAQLYPTFCSVEAAPIAVLYDLYVDAIARKKVVGNALLSGAEQFARDSGAVRLELATGKDNLTAQNAYESRGWRRDEEFHHYELGL